MRTLAVLAMLLAVLPAAAQDKEPAKPKAAPVQDPPAEKRDPTEMDFPRYNPVHVPVPAIALRATSCSTASAKATYPPVIDAVRVPPSACSTSQSMVMVRSPSAFMSVTARNERPIRRWIS